LQGIPASIFLSFPYGIPVSIFLPFSRGVSFCFPFFLLGFFRSVRPLMFFFFFLSFCDSVRALPFSYFSPLHTGGFL